MSDAYDPTNPTHFHLDRDRQVFCVEGGDEVLWFQVARGTEIASFRMTLEEERALSLWLRDREVLRAATRPPDEPPATAPSEVAGG